MDPTRGMTPALSTIVDAMALGHPPALPTRTEKVPADDAATNPGDLFLARPEPATAPAQGAREALLPRCASADGTGAIAERGGTHSTTETDVLTAPSVTQSVPPAVSSAMATAYGQLFPWVAQAQAHAHIQAHAQAHAAHAHAAAVAAQWPAAGVPGAPPLAAPLVSQPFLQMQDPAAAAEVMHHVEQAYRQSVEFYASKLRSVPFGMVGLGYPPALPLGAYGAPLHAAQPLPPLPKAGGRVPAKKASSAPSRRKPGPGGRRPTQTLRRVTSPLGLGKPAPAAAGERRQTAYSTRRGAHAGKNGLDLISAAILESGDSDAMEDDEGAREAARAEAAARAEVYSDAALSLKARFAEICASGRGLVLVPPATKFRGVTKHRRTGKFEGHIWASGRQLFLGSFEDEGSAAMAHDVMAIKQKGLSGATTNRPVECYEPLLGFLMACQDAEVVWALRQASRNQ